MIQNDTGYDERIELSEPRLLIPYWDPGERGATDPGDTGDIRLPPGDIVPYLCEGITTAAPYHPDEPMTVFVNVRNWGGGVAGSIAIVRVWWEYPATTFTAMSPTRLVGVTPVEVPPRGTTNKSKGMTFTFPTTPPAHICLVACVQHPKDPAPPPLPALDRHWAQHNLSYVAPDDSGTIDFPFVATNPLKVESDFIVEVQAFAERRLNRLVRMLRAEPIRADARFEILCARELRDTRSERGAGHPYAIALGAGARAPMHLRMRLSEMPEKGQFAAFEILQRRRSEESTVGGIGLIVLAPGQVRGR